MTTQIKRAYLVGNLFSLKGILKEKNWKFDGTRSEWYKDLDWEDEAEVVRTVRGYAGIRNRGVFTVELTEVPAALPVQAKPQASPSVTFSEFMDGENEWE